MSLRLSANHIVSSAPNSDGDDRSSSSDDEEDNTFDDWVSDSADNRPCPSLFNPDKTFTSVAEALNHDKLVHGFDLEETTQRLALDPYKRIRLVNWIRKEKPAPAQAAALQGDEPFFASDEYLIPVLEDDPLLQTGFEDWSDEEEGVNGSSALTEDLESAKKRIAALEKKLQRAKEDLADYRTFIGERLNLSAIADVLKPSDASTSTHVARPLRDDDSHYFQSYGDNDIHSVMIQDKVRTASYAKFIASSPEVFHDAVVLDVGCGSGILSLFAARAGAKRVISVDASHIVEKAEQIVKDNDLEDVITVVRGKVEEISLPDGITRVDVIISEWMGYALLYESMLDSVLHARDRFLRPGGIVAPSQCQMKFALCDAAEIFKERIEFWGDVYGFDLSAMGRDVYEDAVVDVVGPETLRSEPVTLRDLYLPETQPKHLDFTSAFKLVSTSERRVKVHAFVLYFDTFFASTGERLPEDTPVHVVREGDPILAEVWPLGGKPAAARRMSSGEPLKAVGKPGGRVISFSTGPASEPTHWKQTLFLLREPIEVHEGTIVQGTFKCKKNPDNSRELDVEIHYVVKQPGEEGASDAVVQIFRVR